jgi:hypothetical protein
MHTRRVVGALLIIVGLYAFLWGKGKELQAAVTEKKKLEQEQEEEEQRRGESEMT